MPFGPANNEFSAMSPNVIFLRKIYMIHVALGIPLALVLIVWPRLLYLHDQSMDDDSETIPALRSYGSTMMALCIVLYKFAEYDRIKHHRAMAKALLLLHVTGSAVFMFMFIYNTVRKKYVQWYSQPIMGLLSHLSFLIILLWKPGIRWIIKPDWRQHIPFSMQSFRVPLDPGDSSYSSEIHQGVQRAISKCATADNEDSFREASQELWDTLDQDQSGVLSTSEALLLLNQFAIYEKSLYVNAMSTFARNSKTPLNPILLAEGCHWVNTSIKRVDAYVQALLADPETELERVMGKLDIDKDGQVEKWEFHARVREVFFTSSILPITHGTEGDSVGTVSCLVQ